MKISLVRARYHSVWEPQNLMYLSAYLKSKGYHDIQILDGFFEDDKTILDKIQGADFVGFSGTTPQLKHMITLSRKTKEMDPKIKTVVGGFAVSLEPNKVIPEKSIDYVVMGEGEQSLLDVVEGRANRLVSNTPIQDIDSLPNADRDAVDLERYIGIAKCDEGRRVTSVITERGCAFGCTFCAEGEFGTIWRKIDPKLTDNHLTLSSIEYARPNRVRYRNPKLVVKEMCEVRDKFNIEFFKTSDAETNPTRAHFIGLCKEMIEQKLNIPWGANMRADKVDEEICEWAVKANCEEFWIGLESGADEVHQEINKGVTVDMIRKSFNISKKYGITRRMYGFIGTPVETYETIKKTEALIDELDPDVFGMCILCPYPGTAYWRLEFDNMDWSIVDEYANTFWRTEHLTNEELRNEQARLMEKYKHKLATNFRKKLQSGIIAPTGRVLDSLQQHPMRFQ